MITPKASWTLTMGAVAMEIPEAADCDDTELDKYIRQIAAEMVKNGVGEITILDRE